MCAPGGTLSISYRPRSSVVAVRPRPEMRTDAPPTGTMVRLSNTTPFTRPNSPVPMEGDGTTGTVCAALPRGKAQRAARRAGRIAVFVKRIGAGGWWHEPAGSTPWRHGAGRPQSSYDVLAAMPAPAGIQPGQRLSHRGQHGTFHGTHRSHHGGIMQKKGHGSIPDFSRKTPAKKGAPDAASTKTSAPKPAPAVKPQNTSAKGGRRGG